MTTIALSCGSNASTTHPQHHGLRWVDVPATPGKQDIDHLLGDANRVLVHGTDADLAAVVLRALRKDRIGDVAVGYVPVADSPVTRLWNIPVADAEFALQEPARPVPLIRDDSGGVLVGMAVIAPVTGQVYCDDELVLNGTATRMRVSPDPAAHALPEPTADPLANPIDPASDGLSVLVESRKWWRRQRRITTGRALQASFRAATVHRDGVAFPRTTEKFGWYRHTQDLLLIAP